MEEQKIEVKERDMVIDHDDFEMVTADESKLSPYQDQSSQKRTHSKAELEFEQSVSSKRLHVE